METTVQLDRRTFRVARWVTGSLVAVTALCGIGAVISYPRSGDHREALVFAVLTLAGVLATLDSFLTRLVLAPDGAEIFLYFSRTWLPRTEIADVVVDKRRPVAFELRSGRKVKLPPTHGPDLDTLRAWLRATVL